MVEPGPPQTQEFQHLEQVKKLVVWGDHIPGHGIWESIAAHYNEINGDVIVFDLPKLGMKGNSHLPMCDRNSDRITELVLQWLSKAQGNVYEDDYTPSE